MLTMIGRHVSRGLEEAQEMNSAKNQIEFRNTFFPKQVSR